MDKCLLRSVLMAKGIKNKPPTKNLVKVSCIGLNIPDTSFNAISIVLKIIVVKNENEDDFTINGINIASWFQTYHNCSFIITNNKEKDLAQLLIYWIKEYYINEKYFQ